MADAVYPIGATEILNATIDFNTDDFRVVLVDTGTYTYSAAHDFHDDITGIVATSANLSTPTITSGVFDAVDIVFSAVTGATIEAYIVYKWSGASATSPLLFYVDSAAEFPITPNGSDITIVWNAGGIYSAV